VSKSNKITFIPKDEFTFEYAPLPEPMSKNLPSWWRKTEPFVGGERKLINGQYNETVKKCPGILDQMVTGYMLKFPCDIYVDATGDALEVQVHPVHNDTVGKHSREQIEGWTYDKNIYVDDIFRVHPMWVIGTQKGYSTMFVHPSYHDDLPFVTIPAIIDTDMYISDGPFSLLVKRGFKGTIEKGTPLVQCIPYKREEYKSEILEKPDMKALGSIPYKLRAKFGGAYKNFMWEKKVFK
jgi:hypothetical protein